MHPMRIRYVCAMPSFAAGGLTRCGSLTARLWACCAEVRGTTTRTTCARPTATGTRRTTATTTTVSVSPGRFLLPELLRLRTQRACMEASTGRHDECQRPPSWPQGDGGRTWHVSFSWCLHHPRRMKLARPRPAATVQGPPRRTGGVTLLHRPAMPDYGKERSDKGAFHFSHLLQTGQWHFALPGSSARHCDDSLDTQKILQTRLINRAPHPSDQWTCRLCRSEPGCAMNNHRLLRPDNPNRAAHCLIFGSLSRYRACNEAGGAA